MTTPISQSQTRRNAIELTLHRLTVSDPAAGYDAVARLCKPVGVENLMALAIHLADAMAAVTERECGSREAAIESLQQQLAESGARAS